MAIDLAADATGDGEFRVELDDIIGSVGEDELRATYGDAIYEALLTLEVVGEVRSFQMGNGWDEPRLTYIAGEATVYLDGKEICAIDIHPDDGALANDLIVIS